MSLCLRKHLLVVTTCQACILNLFNDAKEITFAEMVETTGIPAQHLRRRLWPLLGGKGSPVLNKTPPGKEISESCVFSVNESFASEHFRVKICGASSSKETEFEKQVTRAKVEEDRRPQIDSAIVRVMKASRVLGHQTLIGEVTQQLSDRFSCSPVIIEKRIDSLIDREFIERDQHDQNVYKSAQLQFLSLSDLPCLRYLA